MKSSVSIVDIDDAILTQIPCPLPFIRSYAALCLLYKKLMKSVVLKNVVTQWLLIFFLALVQVNAFGYDVYDLPTASQSLDARLDLIYDPETKKIEFSTYELVLDDAGKVFIAALIEAAERGVEVKGIIDNKLSKAHPKLVNFLIEKGIKLNFHNPIKLTWRDFLNPFKAFKKFNQRLHDKMFIVNSQTLLIGDKNYGNKYYKQLKVLDPKAGYVKGREVVMTGDGVSDYVAYFQEMWEKYESLKTEDEIEKLKQPISNGLRKKFDNLFSRQKVWIAKRRKQLLDWRKNKFEYESANLVAGVPGSGKSTLDDIFQKIRNAKPGSKVLIENGYLVIFPQLKEAIKEAIKNDVEVIVNLNLKSELWIMRKALEVDLAELVELGVKVYLNRLNPTHAKMVLVENAKGEKEVIITSANFDPRSYNINTESGFSLKSAGLYDFYWKEFNEVRGQKVLYQKVPACEAFYSNSLNAPKASAFSKALMKVMRKQL